MSTSRRSFIKNTSIIVSAAALLPHPYILAAGKKKEILAIQLYTVDKEMHNNAAGTLKTLRDAGYKYVEHANYSGRKFYGYSPADFRKLLNDCGLSLLSGHTVLETQHFNKTTRQFNRDWHYTIEDAALAGQQYLITPWIDRSLWNDEPGFRHFMDVFNRSGELCKSAGLQFGYHNHEFEFTHSFNSLKLYDIILQQTSHDLVSQQLDIGNIYQKGTSINELFYLYPGRFPLMHVKDIIESDQRHLPFRAVPMGEGILDINNILDYAQLTGGTSCFIVDQHNTGTADTLVCARKNYLFLSEMKIKTTEAT